MNTKETKGLSQKYENLDVTILQPLTKIKAKLTKLLVKVQENTRFSELGGNLTFTKKLIEKISKIKESALELAPNFEIRAQDVAICRAYYNLTESLDQLEDLVTGIHRSSYGTKANNQNTLEKIQSTIDITEKLFNKLSKNNLK